MNIYCKTHRRIVSALLSIALILSIFAGGVREALADTLTTVETCAGGFVIYDATDDKVILGKDEDVTRYPASITKIMTALIVCEQVSDMSQTLTFTDAALAEMTSDSSHLPGAMAVSGEEMSIKDALYGMYMVSANECAAQLAITVAGSAEGFTELMNKKAAELGCTGTHFANAHGLHNQDHYTTPHDMAIIFAAALKNKAFFEMATTYTYTISATNKYAGIREMVPGHNILNGNIYYPEVFAGKTGRTAQAGRTLATAAKFGTHTCIIVCMQSTDDAVYNDTLRLLEYARGYYNGLYTDMTWTATNDLVYVVGTTSLSVRNYPSAVGTEIVDHLLYGTGVIRRATWGEWSQVVVNDRELYVYNDYLSTTQPAEEFDPESAVKSTTRAIVHVEFEAEETTAPDVTEEAGASSEAGETETAKKSGVTINVDDLLVDENETHTASENTGLIKKDFRQGAIMTIMVVCIILMVLIAVAYFYSVISEKKKRERRRREREERKQREQAQAKKKNYRNHF
ncbi:MAG: serine hydrolase [Lachnospiraceae bacterium]|nr:serine hydrolase [Lachnospiraceae bacterium]